MNDYKAKIEAILNGYRQIGKGAGRDEKGEIIFEPVDDPMGVWLEDSDIVEATACLLQLIEEARIEELSNWLKAAEDQEIQSVPVGSLWYRIEELKKESKSGND